MPSDRPKPKRPMPPKKRTAAGQGRTQGSKPVKKQKLPGRRRY